MKKSYRKLCALILPLLGVAACDPIDSPDMYGPPMYGPPSGYLMYGPGPVSYVEQPKAAAPAPAPEIDLDIDEDTQEQRSE